MNDEFEVKDESTKGGGHAESVSEDQRLPVVRQVALLGLMLVAILWIGFMPAVFNALTGTSESQPAEAARAVEDTTEERIDEAVFESIALTGEAAFVLDVNAQRVLYMKNPDRQLPIASITKLMTALVAYEIMEGDEEVSITPAAISQDGDSGLFANETFTRASLSDLTLVSSSNDGAFALAASAGAALDDAEPARSFVEAMNIRADELSLPQTYFRNPTGLDISETEAGAYSSARDIAFLLEYILTEHPEILEATTEQASIFYNEAGEYHEAENTNAIVGKIPGLIGSKTGYTTLAGGNLAIAFDAGLNRPIIAVVLGSTYTGRFDDMLKLVQAVMQSE